MAAELVGFAQPLALYAASAVLLIGSAVVVGLGVGVEGFGSPDAIGFGAGAGLAIVTTPLFQTSFLPDFTQVNLVDLVPAFTT